MKALAAARETLYQRGRGERAVTRFNDPLQIPPRSARRWPAAGRRAGPARGGRPRPRARSRCPGERYQVVVHVDATALADPDQPGQSVSRAARASPRKRRGASRATRARGDAARRGRPHRGGRGPDPHDSPALRRALHHRDQNCRFPGCGLPFGEGHHVRHWAQGGPTTLSNLALLCRRHHRAVHEEGYQVDRQADGALRFRRPDGRLLPRSLAQPQYPPTRSRPSGLSTTHRDSASGSPGQVVAACGAVRGPGGAVAPVGGW
jgi:5-methylcytosine-specific restriction endonuclease McrA